MTNTEPLRIELESIGCGWTRVHFRGRVLLERAHDPEHNACRALFALGHSGLLTSKWCGSTIDAMRLDIEAGALRTADGSPYKPFDVERLRSSRGGPKTSVRVGQRASANASPARTPVP